MMIVECTRCHGLYPDDELPYICKECGGIYDFSSTLEFIPNQIKKDSLEGYQNFHNSIWRYISTFGLPESAIPVSLGEGGTPLVWSDVHGHRVGFKCEYLNPTGSFKDRGSALLVSFLKSRNIKFAVEDSSGNAGASFSAYTSRAGINARIFVPEYAAQQKRSQIETYGAEVVCVEGPRSSASKAVRKAAEEGIPYASHAYLPFLMPGIATIAYELVEQMGKSPETVITPVGQGGLLLGLTRGFSALLDAGIIEKLPVIIGVQAKVCAPLWVRYQYGESQAENVTEGETIAEGVRVRHPLRADAIMANIDRSEGKIVAVEEGDIYPGLLQLAKRGLYVEPTSAIVWDGLLQVMDEVQDPVVVILTGSGLKHTTM